MSGRRTSHWWTLSLLLTVLLVPLAAAAPASAAPADETGKYYVVGPPVHGQRDYLYSIALRTLGNGNRFREIIDLNRGREQPDGTTFTDGVQLAPGWILVLPRDADGPGVRTGALPAIRPPTPRASPSPVAPSPSPVAPSPTAAAPSPSFTPPPTAPAESPPAAEPTTPAVTGPRAQGPQSGLTNISPNLIRIGAAVLAVALAVVAILVLPRRAFRMRSVTLDDGPWPPERHHTPTPAELAAGPSAATSSASPPDPRNPPPSSPPGPSGPPPSSPPGPSGPPPSFPPGPSGPPPSLLSGPPATPRSSSLSQASRASADPVSPPVTRSAASPMPGTPVPSGVSEPAVLPVSASSAADSPASGLPRSGQPAVPPGPASPGVGISAGRRGPQVPGQTNGEPVAGQLVSVPTLTDLTAAEQARLPLETSAPAEAPSAPPPEWPPFAVASPAAPAAPARPQAAAQPDAGSDDDDRDLPRPTLPVDGEVPYVRTELKTESGPILVRLVGVTTGPSAPAYAWLADSEPAPLAAVPLVLGRKGPWQLQIDLGRAPDVFTLVGVVDECRRLAAAYARQLHEAGVAVAVVGDALGAETVDGCRRLTAWPEPDDTVSGPHVVITAGLPAGAGGGIRGLAAGSKGRYIPLVIGPVPYGRWSAQLSVGD
ncbi:hypothetical protein E0H26_14290 [Micromonospora zingiberis]|uniref:LysM domain-containing protein n=1 Tax=Micromonospora zingiberis TaxID=2053011 RepID=A0A4R0GH81_9ACTN|nr:hypothetical protein [Micromonospora zingiberis]TCB96784.1 hypothetical protein E0H26_14290 [Micromonospora zingiberis]